MGAMGAAELPAVGNVYEQRRLRLDMTIGHVAQEAGINRDTASAIEKGGGSPETRGRYGDALDRLEAEAGLPPIELRPAEAAAPTPEPRGYVESERGGIVRIRLEGVFGAEAAVVEAPADNPDALAAALDIIMRRMKSAEESAGDPKG